MSTRNINYKNSKLFIELARSHNWLWFHLYTLEQFINLGKRRRRKIAKHPYWKTNNIDNNFETFIVERTSSNIQYIIHNFCIKYQQRPDIFEYFFPYEFSNKFNKINNTCYNRFHQNHPQYDTHYLYEYKIPKILVIQNYTIPSQVNDLENYARTICILFSSWRTLSNIKKYLTTTWDVTLKTSYPTFFDFKKEKIKNVNMLHECKESRNIDHLLRASIKDNIDEDNKGATSKHPFYDDEFETLIEEDIHNISIQQNDLNKITTVKT